MELLLLIVVGLAFLGLFAIAMFLGYVLAFAVAVVAPPVTFFPLSRRARKWFAIAVFLVIASLLDIASLPSWMIPFGFAATLGVAASGACLVWMLDPASRPQLRWAARVYAREPPAVDFAATRRAAGHAGRTFRDGPVTVWTDVDTELHGQFRHILDETVADFRRITGFALPALRRLRVLCFERRDAARTYSGLGGGVYEGIIGYYGGFFTRRVVLSREDAEQYPATLRRVLAHEYAHYLTKMAMGRLPKPWLSEGLAELVATRVAQRRVSEGAQWRWLRAARARGDLVTEPTFFAIWYPWLVRHLQEDLELEKFRCAAAFYGQSRQVLTLLFETDQERFAAWLGGYRKARNQRRHFQNALGFGYEEALRRLEERVETRGLPPIQAPDPADRRRIETELIGRLLDHTAERNTKRWAIRRLGLVGYAWRVDRLIDILDGSDVDLRAEAVHSLENIAGERLGTNAASWRKWARTLTNELTGWPEGSL